MRTRASSAEGPGDLDELLLPRRQVARRGAWRGPPAGRRGRAASRPRSAIARRSSSRAARRRCVSRPRNMLAATIRFSARFSSWWMRTMPASDGVGRRRRSGPACRRARISPASGVVDAGEDLHQRGLAGPVLADDGQHLAGARVSDTPSRARTPGKRLSMPVARQAEAAWAASAEPRVRDGVGVGGYLPTDLNWSRTVS